jgi:hypothetical protein
LPEHIQQLVSYVIKIQREYFITHWYYVGQPDTKFGDQILFTGATWATKNFQIPTPGYMQYQ